MLRLKPQIINPKELNFLNISVSADILVSELELTPAHIDYLIARRLSDKIINELIEHKAINVYVIGDAPEVGKLTINGALKILMP